MNAEQYLAGESKHVEYKLTIPKQSINYTKTVVAFANCQGGHIIFGVENNTWQVKGIPEDQVFVIKDAIANAITDSCEPMVLPDISLRDYQGRTIIDVAIQPGMQRPYYIKSLGRDQGTFVRIAGTTRLADEATIRELMFEGSNRSFDKAPCLGLTITDEDIDRLCERMTDIAKGNANSGESVKPVTRRQLLSWGVLIERDSELLPANAYAILTGNEAVRSVVQCGVFKGNTKAVFVDRRQFTGPAWELIEQAYQYVLRNIHLGARFDGVYRHDVYEIPPDAIRELIVNAIVHRSYIDHSSIQVAVYDNRLEITSPGRLPMGQTIERMKEGYSKIRNEALASAFEYMGYIEHWGSGIPRIIEEVTAAGLEEPEFLGGDTDLRINIYRNVHNAEPGEGSDVAKSAVSRQGNGSDVAKTDVSRQESATDVAKSVVSRQGNGSDVAKTDVSRHGAQSDAENVSDEPVANQQKTLVLNELQLRHELDVTDVVELLGIHRRQAQRLMKSLVDSGLIQRKGASRSTRYVLPDGMEMNGNE